MRARAFLVSLMLTVTTTALAQSDTDDSVTIGGIKLRFGMPQAKVLEQLGTDHRFQDTGVPGNSVVITRSSPSRIVGRVTFRDGILTGAGKAEGVAADASIHTLTSILVSAMRTVETRSCVVSLDESSPDIKFVTLACGQRYVEIGLPVAEKLGVTVMESIQR